MREMSEKMILKVDDDGHWYCIPMRLEKQFNELEEKDDDFESFNKEFGPYMLSCPLSCYSLTNFRREF
jgi:hypothetical protein